MKDTQFTSIRAVIFDMDGTLVRSDLDFDLIRREASVPEDIPMLEYLASAKDREKRKAREVLLRHENRAAQEASLLPGTRHVLNQLRNHAIPLGLLTRNSRRSVDLVLEKFGLKLDMTVSRDDATPKPSPEPVRIMADNFGTTPEQTLVVGDYLFDIQAARRAGARSAIVKTERNQEFRHLADTTLDTLNEVLNLIGIQT